MAQNNSQRPVALQTVNRCLIATIQIELYEAALASFREDLLNSVQASDIDAVILDVSAIDVMDAHDFEALRRTAATVKLMGVKAIVVGLRPGIASTLVDMDVSLEGLTTTLTVADAFLLLEPEEAVTTELFEAPDSEEETDAQTTDSDRDNE